MNLTFLCNRSLKTPVAFCLLFILAIVTCEGQTFSTKNIKLYDYLNTFFIQEIPIKVTGLPTKLDTLYGLESIRLNIHHNRTSDLKIQLQAPDGTTIWLTNRNGGLLGVNYINTRFSQYGKDGLINSGKSPFTGEYIPDGQITYLNNGSNPNGEWKLLIEDLKLGEDGFLDAVDITFGNKPAFIHQKRYCTLEDPQFCRCNLKAKTCSLLPDLVVVPYFTQTQYQEFPANDKVYPGQLKYP